MYDPVVLALFSEEILFMFLKLMEQIGSLEMISKDQPRC